MDIKKNNNKIGIVILFVCIFAIGFVAGRVFQGGGGTLISNQQGVNLDMFWNVWDIMKNKYVDVSKADSKSMLYGSIKGMVGAFGDPATVFLDPTETKEFKDASEGKYFEGIGAELGYEKEQIVVVSPLEGSPAKAAGIRAGDLILAVDGVSITAEDSIYDIIAKIRGDAGTEVTLKILHKNTIDPVDIKIKRSEITVSSMSLTFEGKNKEIADLKVSRFTDATYGEWTANWDKNVDEIVKSGAKKMILDLRGNPGGFFDAAIYAADDFLGEGKILAQQQDGKGVIEKYESHKGGKLLDIQLVVLVDGGSASASEILSGALQQAGRAKIIGVPTYGKGTAQNVLDFPDGSSLHITILKWLLPDGNWLNKENPIKPDIEVKRTEQDFKNGLDPELSKAIEELSK